MLNHLVINYYTIRLEEPGGLGLGSLFYKPSSRPDDGSTRSTDMEEEVIDYVDSEMPALQDKTGPPLVSSKLAQKKKNHWQN